ncbi:translocation/assembly module TamB domain-containing protein, partial [bacterium]|nr:translocation/assembly module TamB domain-containing protein [bacterium]
MFARLMNIVVWITLALLAVPVAVVLLALSPGVQTLVAHRLLRSATADWNGSLHLGRVHAKPNGNFLVRDVRIEDESGALVLGFDTLSATIRIPALRRDSIHVRTLHVSGLSANLVLDSSGSTNLQRALASRTPSPRDSTPAKFRWIVRLDTATVEGRYLRFAVPDMVLFDDSTWSAGLRAVYGNDSLDYAVALHVPPRLQVKASGFLAANDPLTDFAGEIIVHADSLFMARFPDPFPAAGNVALSASYQTSPDSLHLQANLSSSAIGKVVAGATIPFPPDSIAGHGEIRFHEISLSPLLHIEEPTRLNGHLRFHKKAMPDPISGWVAHANFTDCRYGTYELPHAEVTVHTADSVVFVSSFLETGFGRLRISGDSHGLDTATMEVAGDIQFDRLRLQHFIETIPDTLSPLSGSLRVRSRGLNLETIRAEYSLILDTVRLGRHEIAALSASGRLQGDSLMVDTLRTALAGGTADGRIFARRGRELAYEARIEFPDLNSLRPFAESFVELPDTLSGSFSLDARGTGSLTGDSLSALSLQGNVRLDSLHYDELAVHRVRLRITEGDLDSLTFRGALLLSGLSAANQTVDSVSLLFDGTPGHARVNARLWARADSLKLAASFEAIRSGADLTLTIDDLNVEAFGIAARSEGTTTLTLSERRAEIDWLQLRSPVGILRASGYLQRQGEQDMVLELSGLRSGELARILKQPLPESRVNVRVQVTGPDTAIVGDLHLSADSVSLDGSPLADEFVLRATVDRLQTTTSGFVIWLGDTLTVFSGRLPARISVEDGFILADSLPMSGNMRILEQPLAKLNSYLPFGMEFGGFLSGDLTFSGTPASPDWSGTFGVRNGKYHDARVGVDYRDLTITGSLDRDTLRISRFDARSGGTLSGSGQAVMAFPLPQELQIELKFDNFEALNGPQLSVRATGDVSISGPLNRLHARGQVQTDQVLYRITQTTTKTIEEIDLAAELAKLRGDTVKPSFLLAELYTPMSHELVVDVPGNCWMRGSGVNIELTGRLWLIKERGYDPSIAGEILVREGRVQFLGRTLRVDEGVVRYEGPLDNPTLDITATSPQLEAQGTKVQVKITGPLSRTQV